jgi:hypothetical protein
MDNVEFKVNWNANAQKKLEEYPDKVVYTVARITLDKAYPTIPLSKDIGSGNLRRTSASAGVRGSNGNYYIGSYTSYAMAVYTMEERHKVNWSTPGTGGKWYERLYKKEGKAILNTAIERNELK